MRILAIDLGKTYGWAYKNGDDEESGFGTVEGLLDFYAKINNLVILWKPEILVVSQTNSYGHFGTARQMFFKAGIAFLIAEKYGIPGIELNDKSARKSALGSGALKKLDVQALPQFQGLQADQIDALVLARGWHLQTLE